jgi:hypothetical protein
MDGGFMEIEQLLKQVELAYERYERLRDEPYSELALSVDRAHDDFVEWCRLASAAKKDAT